MRGGAVGAIGVLLAVGAPGASAAPARPPDPADIAVAALRQVCDLQWVEGVCEATGYPEPQYRSSEDPSPGQPLVQRVGVLHEHSGYSDGDPDAIPADYWRAAREGHNTVDGGDGDSGVIIDYLISSEHSENEKLPITTAEACIDPNGIPDAIAALELEGIIPPLACSNVENADHYRKWNETLAQAIAGSDSDFTAMRGFEWTNDYYNHMGVYFSRNVVNAKIDGSYLAMDPMWSWLQEPPEKGGGGDALVVFNHPGGQPALTPFDGDLPHNQILQATKGGANWNDLAHVPAVDERVAGIEVNGGDDLLWYLKALRNGWHLGPVAAEDEHQLEWSTSADGKTLMLTRGTSPRDYYFALQHHRTIAIGEELVGGEPGQRAVVPSVEFYADGTSLQDPAAHVLGSVVEGGTDHKLNIALDGLAPGTPAVLLSDYLAEPEPLGTTDAHGALRTTRSLTTPDTGEHWFLVVACPVGTEDCGTNEAYDLVTAPIWFKAPTATPAPTPAPVDRNGAPLPATGGGADLLWPLAAVAVAVALLRRVRATR